MIANTPRRSRPTDPRRRLIVTGDDFGASEAVNHAILQAHRQGILTSASLMPTGLFFEQAAAMARAHPRLGIGIHLTLMRDRALLSHQQAPDLVDRRGRLPSRPVLTGLRFFFDPRLIPQLQREMDAQIRKVLHAGIVPSHIDGHLHLHVHPTVLAALLPLARRYGIPAVRLPVENRRVTLRLDPRNRCVKQVYAWIYARLGQHAARRIRAMGLGMPDAFYGLLNSGRMTRSFLMGVLPCLPPGITEIGLHPALEVPPELHRWAPDYHYREEYDALVDPQVKAEIHRQGIRLTNYHVFAGRQSGNLLTSG